jgi:hypothetical protein
MLWWGRLQTDKTMTGSLGCGRGLSQSAMEPRLPPDATIRSCEGHPFKSHLPGGSANVRWVARELDNGP